MMTPSAAVACGCAAEVPLKRARPGRGHAAGVGDVARDRARRRRCHARPLRVAALVVELHAGDVDAAVGVERHADRRAVEGGRLLDAGDRGPARFQLGLEVRGAGTRAGVDVAGVAGAEVDRRAGLPGVERAGEPGVAARQVGPGAERAGPAGEVGARRRQQRLVLLGVGLAAPAACRRCARPARRPRRGRCWRCRPGRSSAPTVCVACGMPNSAPSPLSGVAHVDRRVERHAVEVGRGVAVARAAHQAGHRRAVAVVEGLVPDAGHGADGDRAEARRRQVGMGEVEAGIDEADAGCPRRCSRRRRRTPRPSTVSP